MSMASFKTIVRVIVNGVSFLFVNKTMQIIYNHTEGWRMVKYEARRDADTPRS